MLRMVGQESCFKTPSTAHVPGFPLFPVIGVQSVDPFPGSPAREDSDHVQCEQDTIVPGQGGRVLTPLLSPRPEQGLAKSPVRALEKPRRQLSPRRAPGCEAHRRPKGPGHSGSGVGAGASLPGCHPGHPHPQLHGMPLTHGGVGGA